MRRSLLLTISVIASSIPVFAQQALASPAWNALRPLSNFALEIDAPVKWLVLLVSLAIFGISLMGYSKSKSKRILLISFAFFLFALKASIKVLDIYYSPGQFFSAAANDAADFLIMLSMFAAIFYKRKGAKFFERDSGE